MQHIQSQDNISMEQSVFFDQVQGRDVTSVWRDLARENISVGESYLSQACIGKIFYSPS